MTVAVSDDVLRRIWAEYAEMPGMSLTVAQGQRLWGLDESTCAAALEMLTAAGFLRKTVGDHYTRATEGRASLSSLRMARAELTGNGIPLVTEQPRRKAT
jgi:hypothetical protein